MPRIVSFDDRHQRVGEAGESAAAGEIDAEAVQQRHGAEGDEDRMHADDRHQQAGEQADGDAEDEAGGEGAGEPEGECGAARVRRHQCGQDPGHQQSRLVRGGDDREVDAAGDERDRHREGEQAELGQLEHHRLQRGAAREGDRLNEREEAGQRQ